MPSPSGWRRRPRPADPSRHTRSGGMRLHRDGTIDTVIRTASLPGLSAGLGALVATVLLAVTAFPALAQDEAEPAPDLGATFGLYEDDFSQVGLWGQNSDERGTLENAGGSYRITLAEDDASLWTWVGFPGKDDAWRMEADVTLEAGPGAGGLMCGSDADPDDFLVGVVNGANEWALLDIHDSTWSLVAGGPLPAGIDLSAGGTTRLALDCAVTGSEADQVRLWADGQLLGSQEAAPRIGPFNHRRPLRDVSAHAVERQLRRLPAPVWPRIPGSAGLEPRRDRAGRFRRLLGHRSAGMSR